MMIVLANGIQAWWKLETVVYREALPKPCLQPCILDGVVESALVVLFNHLHGIETRWLSGVKSNFPS